MTVVFALGVSGGAVGCILMLLRKKHALTVFVVSLAGYIARYAGDVALGLFGAFSTPQVAISTTIVMIPTALLWLAHMSQRRGWLTTNK